MVSKARAIWLFREYLNESRSVEAASAINRHVLHSNEPAERAALDVEGLALYPSRLRSSALLGGIADASNSRGYPTAELAVVSWTFILCKVLNSD